MEGLLPLIYLKFFFLPILNIPKVVGSDEASSLLSSVPDMRTYVVIIKTDEIEFIPTLAIIILPQFSPGFFLVSYPTPPYFGSMNFTNFLLMSKTYSFLEFEEEQGIISNQSPFLLLLRTSLKKYPL